MNALAAVRLFAALVLGLGLALAHAVHPAWLGLVAFVGLNMTQFSFTGFCPAYSVFRRGGLACPAEPEAGVLRRAQVVIGLTIMLVVAVGVALPALGLPFVTVGVGLVAVSLAQSAFTGTSLAIAAARRLATPR